MSRRPLSKEQIRQLGILRTAAFRHQLSLGLVALPPDLVRASKTAQAEFWAHQQIAEATQRVCSARDMIDDEYAKVKLHFLALCGPEHRKQVPAALGKVIEGAACDRAPGCEYLRQIHEWLLRAGYKVGYAIAIMKGKFHGQTDFRRLTESELKQLHDTVVNRCRAKLDLGAAQNRNKKQRQERAGPPPRQPESGCPHPQSPPPAAQKSRTYILKPRPSAVDPTNIPF